MMIIDQRMTSDSKIEYYVMWEDINIKTWEPADSLPCDLINQWNRAQNNNVQQ